MRVTWCGLGTEHKSFHKQQATDGTAFADNLVAPQVICSKPQPQVSVPQHSLKVNNSQR